MIQSHWEAYSDEASANKTVLRTNKRVAFGTTNVRLQVAGGCKQ